MGSVVSTCHGLSESCMHHHRPKSSPAQPSSAPDAAEQERQRRASRIFCFRYSVALKIIIKIPGLQ